MASTKKKRQTKHRGNAAGFVETRGRTGRNRPVAEGTDGKGAARKGRAARVNRPPSWSSSLQKAVLAVAIFVVIAIVALHQPPAAAIALGAFMVLLYTPMGFYMDSYFYKRRRNQAAAAKAAPTKKAKT